MGLRVTKLVAGILFLLAGLWFALGDWLGNDVTVITEVAGIPLALTGLLFLMRPVQAFDLFRYAIAAVVAHLVIRWGGSGATVVLDALQGQAVTNLIGGVVGVAGSLLLIGLVYYALWSKSNIRRILENIFSIPELLGKLVFTLTLLAIYRVGFHVPLPGVNQAELQSFAEQRQEGPLGKAFEYFSMFTGGNLQQSTLFGLGIMPYITASIIFTLLVNVIPSLERLQKEGPAGQKKIQEYTRYATVGLCIVQAIFWMRYMFASGLIYPEYSGSVIIFLAGVFGLTAGTIFLMWLGEQIDEYGIGNGISLLIMAGIVVRLPTAISMLITQTTAGIGGSGDQLNLGHVLFLGFSFVFVVAGAILITQGQRRIPIQYAKQTRGRRTYGGQRHYMPLRVNHGGVMPIIFASSLMIFPPILANWLGNFGGMGWKNAMAITESALRPGTFTYTVLSIGLIFFFAYFWTTVNFRPKDMADQLRDMGNFIPGLRPGKRTADYLERVMERITYCGAAFLAIIAVLPNLIATHLGIPFQISAFLGGTGLLIMVSVTLDLVQRIEANLVMRNYGGFLGGSSRIKGAYG